jgi:Zn-dependent M28 family amino/carboxypeptidase
LVLGSVAFLALIALLRQPVLGSEPFRGTLHANPSLLRKHVQFLTNDVRPRSWNHPANLRATSHYIAAQFRAAGARTSFQTFHVRAAEYSNVIAEFGPANTADCVLVTGAHYDAFAETGPHPGADDNASGLAGLFELARLLKGQVLQRPVVLVAFANEEPPFFGSDDMGSAVHAARLAADGRPVRGMICLEMIGYFSPGQSWPNPLFA